MFSNRPIRFVLLYLIAAGCCYCTVRRDSVAIKVLFDAVERNDPVAVWEAINNGSDNNGRNATGFSPLHVAAAGGHVRAMSVLLMAKANKEAANDAGDRPLHLAAANGNSRAAGLLVVAGANLNATAQDGSTPVLRAAGHNSTVALLHSLSYFQVAQTTDLTAGTSSQSEVRRDSVAIKVLFDAVERNDPVAVWEAINNGSDINGRNATGFSPLHVAAAGGHVRAMSVLLMAKANKEAANDAGDRPLHLAAANGNSRAAGLLVVAGANLNATAQDGSTPVLRAAGHNSTVALLHSLSYFQVGRGRAASDAARKALRDAVRRNDPQAVRVAIENGADIEEGRDSDNGTPLHEAAYSGSDEVLCVLLRAGADKEAVNSYYNRPLHLANRYGQDGAVALLAVAGANLHSRGWASLTPLQQTVLGRPSTAVVLLRILVEVDHSQSRI